MVDCSGLLKTAPYSVCRFDKNLLLTKMLIELTMHHYCKCKPYSRMLDAMGFDVETAVTSHTDLPFLPVSLFKSLELMSIPSGEVFKTLYSSGTTGQTVSKIYLSKENASLQQKVLVRTISEFTGLCRGPMLIIDTPNVLKERNSFSARGAAILGFSLFGIERCFALDDEMQINIKNIEQFIKNHTNERIFVFGFTYLIWQFFFKALKKAKIHLNLSNSLMIHGGGWKSISNEAISNSSFREGLHEVCGIEQIHDYYGMVEQTGNVYLECFYGNYHSNIFGDICTRRFNDFSICDTGESGLIQVVSVLPRSYCGHNLLTEDIGTVLGEDNCPCGRLGKYFQIQGRIQKAEIRGCSDTYGK